MSIETVRFHGLASIRPVEVRKHPLSFVREKLVLQFGFGKKSFPHVEEELRFRPAVGRRVQHSLGNGPPELLGPPHSSATFGRQKLVDAVDSGQTLSQRALECLGNDERWEECRAVEERPF